MPSTPSRSERVILAVLTVAVVCMAIASVGRQDWSPFALALAGAIAGAVGATWYWKELWR